MSAVIPDQINDENNPHIFNSIVPMKADFGVKKVNISDKERMMDGAPVGDLYDVEVKENSALKCFNSKETATEFLERAYTRLLIDADNTSWADQFEAIEWIRIVLLHHIELLNDDCKVFSAVCVGIGSLRSSCVKNALHCVECLFRFQNIHMESLRLITLAIASKMASGPKFVSKQAEHVLGRGMEQLSTARVLRLLSDGTILPHKNADVTSTLARIVSDRIIGIASVAEVVVSGEDGVDGDPRLSRDELCALVYALCQVAYGSNRRSANKSLVIKALQRLGEGLARSLLDAVVLFMPSESLRSELSFLWNAATRESTAAAQESARPTLRGTTAFRVVVPTTAHRSTLPIVSKKPIMNLSKRGRSGAVVIWQDESPEALHTAASSSSAATPTDQESGGVLFSPSRPVTQRARVSVNDNRSVLFAEGEATEDPDHSSSAVDISSC